MTELAIFDLDYTITRQGTWGRFIKKMMNGRPFEVPGLLVSAAFMQLQYVMGRVPRVCVKQAMLRRSIMGMNRNTLEEAADEFVRVDLEKGLNQDVIDALNEHLATGHTVLIASAGVDLLVDRYTKALGAHGSVSTKMSWLEDNCLTDQFANENCYGPEKMQQVEDWLKSRNFSPTRVVVYSDCASDAPLLEFADKAVMVRPGRKCRKYAQQKGFEIWS